MKDDWLSIQLSGLDPALTKMASDRLSSTGGRKNVNDMDQFGLAR